MSAPSESFISAPRKLAYQHVSKLKKYFSELVFGSKKQWDTNNVVVITGASSGIGLQIAVQYAARRCKVVLASRNMEELEKVGAKCREYGSDALCISCDVTKESDCQKLMEETVKKFGRIDILVLNAGVGIHHFFSKTTDMTIFKKLMDVNFFGYLYCTRHAFDHLAKAKGTIIVVSSVSGEMGLPYRTAYCASKFAVTGFFEALRTELSLRPNIGEEESPIHITIVCPPTVSTNLRKNSLTTDAAFSGLHDKDAFTAQEVAAVIIDAADNKLRKVYFPFSSFFGVYLRPFFPDFVDFFAKRKAKL